jgi:hypothetical protein
MSGRVGHIDLIDIVIAAMLTREVLISILLIALFDQ